MTIEELQKLFDDNNRFGCVGSRDDLDEKRIQTCALISYYLAQRGKTVHTGNAVGCDQVYAMGANKVNARLVYLYLTNKTHNAEAIMPGNHLILNDDHPEWAPIAKKYHGGYDKLSDFVQKLFNRNAGIVTNSDVLIAMSNRNKVWGGGTGHDIRIAEGLGIPVINLNDEETVENIWKLIISSGLVTLNGKQSN